MVFDGQESSGAGELDFTQNGQVISWDSTKPVQKDEYGFTRFTIHYTSEAQAGEATLLNFMLQTGSNTYQQTLTTFIPKFPPKITWPIDGESCSTQFLNMTVTGYAIPGSLIRLYEDDQWKATGAANDEDGLFSIVYNSDQAGIDDYTRTYVARLRRASDPYDCGEQSNTITLTKQTSFWCPSRSTWEGDYQHRARPATTYGTPSSVSAIRRASWPPRTG